MPRRLLKRLLSQRRDSQAAVAPAAAHRETANVESGGRDWAGGYTPFARLGDLDSLPLFHGTCFTALDGLRSSWWYLP